MKKCLGVFLMLISLSAFSETHCERFNGEADALFLEILHSGLGFSNVYTLSSAIEAIRNEGPVENSTPEIDCLVRTNVQLVAVRETFESLKSIVK